MREALFLLAAALAFGIVGKIDADTAEAVAAETAAARAATIAAR